MQQEYEIKLDMEADVMQALFGRHDSFLFEMEKQLHVTFVDRDGKLKIKGNKAEVEKADDRIRYRPCRHRKDLSGHGYGHHGV